MEDGDVVKRDWTAADLNEVMRLCIIMNNEELERNPEAEVYQMVVPFFFGDEQVETYWSGPNEENAADWFPTTNTDGEMSGMIRADSDKFYFLSRQELDDGV